MREINCVFDGACEPRNPGGAMGVGAAIFEGRTLITNHSSFLPAYKENTNNIAEYMALNWVLAELEALNLFCEQVTVYGDSQLVIKQMKDEWSIKKGAYVQHALEARYRLRLFKNIDFVWVPREKNRYADELSKKALTENKIQITIR